MLGGKWLSAGESVNKFEREFSKKFGFEQSVMVNSGSSANLVMIAALKEYFGWEDGEEIIVCACGFPTTINPIIQNGLKPVFVDIDYSDLNWDLDQLEAKITDKTVAVFSSPVLGNAYNIDRFLDIRDKYSVEYIADNWHSLGSKWNNEYLTFHAVAASCSFYPAHHLCTIEGGMYHLTIQRLLLWHVVMLGGEGHVTVLDHKTNFLMVFVVRDLVAGWMDMIKMLIISMSLVFKDII